MMINFSYNATLEEILDNFDQINKEIEQESFNIFE